MAEKKRKRLTNREWWAKYGPRFEETDRKLLERIAYYEKKIAEERAAREAASEEAPASMGEGPFANQPQPVYPDGPPEGAE